MSKHDGKDALCGIALLLGAFVAACFFVHKVTMDDTGVTEDHLRTVQHDGHLFIVTLTSNRPTTIIHHPDCPCKKEETE